MPSRTAERRICASACMSVWVCLCTDVFPYFSRGHRNLRGQVWQVSAALCISLRYIFWLPEIPERWLLPRHSALEILPSLKLLIRNIKYRNSRSHWTIIYTCTFLPSSVYPKFICFRRQEASSPYKVHIFFTKERLQTPQLLQDSQDPHFKFKVPKIRNLCVTLKALTRKANNSREHYTKCSFVTAKPKLSWAQCNHRWNPYACSSFRLLSPVSCNKP